MRILFCGLAFPKACELLRKLLPDDEVISCSTGEVTTLGVEADVLIPLMHRLETTLIRTTKARLIQQWGVGLEGVDIPEASRNGILVCNIPAHITANADSTAEHALFLMLGLARRVHECSSAFREGLWGEPLGEALLGNTALIVGLGNVGKALARKLKALGMNVEAIRRTVNAEIEREIGLVRAADLSQLYHMAGSAKFVISTISLTEETRNLFDKKLFHAMDRSAYVVNVSRGPVVNEKDLIEALQNGVIAGAGLDVYSQEPLAQNSPLLKMKNVFATPHVAGATRQNYEGISRTLAANLRLFKQGKIPRYCVNADSIR